MISAFVICRNEEAQISGCLESVGWCDEVVVVDGLSTDRTVEIAREAGARVFDRRAPKERARATDLVFSPARAFLSRYVKHQGFRDGARGYVMAQIDAFYRWIAVAKRLERQSTREPSKDRSGQ